MSEFWESSFQEKQAMWGFDPAESALSTAKLFQKHGLNKVLIPGFGYGRNAQPFTDKGMDVTGIEVSETAIDLAREHFGNRLKIYHGDVSEMPFDNKKYEGIFCYGLIHLLDNQERKKLIHDCYNQLTKNGYMVFTAITKEAPNFGKGELISKDRYEFHKGAKIFFYDQESVNAEFEKFGLFEITEVDENQPMYLIKCKKE